MRCSSSQSQIATRAQRNIANSFVCSRGNEQKKKRRKICIRAEQQCCVTMEYCVRFCSFDCLLQLTVWKRSLSTFDVWRRSWLQLSANAFLANAEKLQLETTCNSQSHHNSFSRAAAARVCASKTIFFCRAECQVCDFGRDRTCVWFRRTHKKLQLDISRPCVVSPKSSNLSTILQIRFCSLAALDLRSESICAQNENEKEKKCSESNDQRARDCN